MRDALEAIGAQIGHPIARLKTEEALRKSNERFRRLVADTDTGFVVLDEAGVVLEANEPYMRLAGRGRMEEIIGHSVIEWTVPEEREHNAAAVTLCARQGNIQDFETIYRHKDGRQSPRAHQRRREPRRFRERTVSFHSAATSPNRKEAEAALVLRKNQLDAIRGVTTELTRDPGSARAPRPCHSAGGRAGRRPKSGVLWLWDEADADAGACVSVRSSFVAFRAVRLRLGEGVSGAVAQRREGLIVNDYPHLARTLHLASSRSTEPSPRFSRNRCCIGTGCSG